MTEKIIKIKPTQRQSYLDRLCRNSYLFAEEISLGILKPINNSIERKEYLDGTFAALVVIRLHLVKAIARLNKLSDDAFEEWNELYKTNRYW